MRQLASWLAALVLASASAAGAVPSCRLAEPAVEAVIAAKATELRGTEYCQFRNYNTLDEVDGDGTDDFIVLFTVDGIEDGGNDHDDFMAVWLSGRSDAAPLVVQTGARGERDPVGISVRDRRIHLRTLEYRPSDPMCCPSGKGEVVYELKDGALRPAPQPAARGKPRRKGAATGGTR